MLIQILNGTLEGRLPKEKHMLLVKLMGFWWGAFPCPIQGVSSRSYLMLLAVALVAKNTQVPVHSWLPSQNPSGSCPDGVQIFTLPCKQ